MQFQNSYVGTLSYWFNTDSLANAPFTGLGGYVTQSGNPVNFFAAGEVPWGLTSDLGFNFETELWGAVGGSTDNLVSTGAWYHVFLSWNTNFATNEKVVNYYINGVSALNPSYNYDTTAGPEKVAWQYLGTFFDWYIPASPTQSGLGNPTPITANKAPLELADIQFWPDTYIDPTPENLGKFISNGKPVDPAGATAAFGQPAFLLSGDDSVNGFRENKGTAGDIFTLTGTITDADTSPSN